MNKIQCLISTLQTILHAHSCHIGHIGLGILIEFHETMPCLGSVAARVYEGGLPHLCVTHDGGQQGTGIAQHVTSLLQGRAKGAFHAVRAVPGGQMYTLHCVSEFSTRSEIFPHYNALTTVN